MTIELHEPVETGPVSAEALAEANRRAADLLVLFNSHFVRSPVGFACWDEGLRCVRVNDALAHLTSCSIEDCYGESMAAVLPELSSGTA